MNPEKMPASPKSDSPKAASPKAASPKPASPKPASPKAASPKPASPKAASPKAGPSEPVPKKNKERPSPSVSAKLHPNQVMKGNDGRMYISLANKNGVYSWKLYHEDDAKKTKKESIVKLSRLPRLRYYDYDNDNSDRENKAHLQRQVQRDKQNNDIQIGDIYAPEDGYRSEGMYIVIDNHGTIEHIPSDGHGHAFVVPRYITAYTKQGFKVWDVIGFYKDFIGYVIYPKELQRQGDLIIENNVLIQARGLWHGTETILKDREHELYEIDEYADKIF